MRVHEYKTHERPRIPLTALLLADAHGLTATTGRLSVLTSNSDTPEVSETSVSANLLETFKVITELSVDLVRDDLVVLTVRDVLSSVQEPVRDLELSWVLKDADDSLKLIRVELTGTLEEVDISLLDDDVGVTWTDTLDFGHSVLDLSLTVNVGVEKTQDMLELHMRLWSDEAGLGGGC